MLLHNEESIVVAGAVLGAGGGLSYGLAEGVYLAFWLEGDIVVYEFIFIKGNSY